MLVSIETLAFVGLSNALTASGDVGGTAGVMVALIFAVFFLIAAIRTSVDQKMVQS